MIVPRDETIRLNRSKKEVSINDFIDAVNLEAYGDTNQTLDCNVARCVILFGQSNAVGAGNGAPAIAPLVPNTYILGFGGDQGATTSTTFQPLNYGTTNLGKAGFGPEMYFASDFQEEYGTDLYIVKCAKGGTTFQQTEGVDDWNVASSGELLDDLKTYIDHAISYFVANDIKVVFDGVIMQQGESDAREGVTNISYFKDARDILGSIATYIGNETPFLSVGLLNSNITPDYGDVEEVIKQQRLLVSSKQSGFFFETSDLPLHDGVHFTASSMASVGKKHFDGYNKYLKKQGFKSKLER